MKILVIFTGGTIGSTVNGEYISTDGKKPYIILERYNKEYPNSIEWHTDNPYTILSENATIDTYRMLAKSVKAGLDKNYDGIIVTHGSDTLQYSAAFLSLILGDDVAPVMLVSSNYVLEDERANGMDNFGAAVDFIVNHRGKGVFVPYKNICKIGDDVILVEVFNVPKNNRGKKTTILKEEGAMEEEGKNLLESEEFLNK